MCQKRNKLSEQILHCRSKLSKICPAVLVQSIRAKIQDANSKLFKYLHQIKAQKLDQLICPQITSDSSPENLKTVVTISENLLLSDSEKSDLSKGLNFVPKSKKPTNFQLSKTLKNSFAAFNWKPFNKEDDSNTSNKDTFETLQIRKSKWTPPEGQFSSLDFFIKKCRHDINKLKFNCNTKISNLSSEDWSALKSLKKRKDILIKAADKGGAVVV